MLPSKNVTSPVAVPRGHGGAGGPASVAVTVKVAVPGVVGVPVIAPVVVSSVSPAGREFAGTLHVTVPVRPPCRSPGARPTTLPRVDSRPIGVFDSGAGGLTVLHECLVTMPHEDFVYLGDGARLPYGPRPLGEIRRFAGEIARYLEGQGVKLVVAACNSATAAALPDLQRSLSVPVLGVIQPEAHAAVRATRNRRVGLLATEATVASGRYEALIWTLDAGVTVVPVACPKLVPLIEGDDPFGEATVAAVREAATPLKEAGVDTVVLGCTHYPLIRPILQRVFGRDVTLVFSADETAREVSETLARKAIENDTGREGAYRFLTTGDPAAFKAMGSRFLQLPIADVERVTVAELESVAA